jgi:enoyl-CoA hydratase/carnithine racemase
MADYSNIIVEATSPIARLTLDRPEKLNALNLELIREVIDACEVLAESGARVVIIGARGRAFSAGFDLDDFTSSDIVDGDDRQRYEAARSGELMAEAIEDLPQVTIAAMQGHVVGGGFVLGVASDLRIASEDMVISVPEVELGIGYAWGAIPRLVQEIGPALTRELVMTCRPFPAVEALQRGIVNQVVPGEDLERTSMELAELIASKPPLGISVVKRRVVEVMRHDFSRDDAADLAAALADAESIEARTEYLRSRSREG